MKPSLSTKRRKRVDPWKPPCYFGSVRDILNLNLLLANALLPGVAVGF